MNENNGSGKACEVIAPGERYCGNCFCVLTPGEKSCVRIECKGKPTNIKVMPPICAEPTEMNLQAIETTRAGAAPLYVS